MRVPIEHLRARVCERPVLGAISSGLWLAMLSLAVSVLTLLFLSLVLPREDWGASAGSGLGALSAGLLFFVAILWVPVFETLLGQVVPVEVANRFGGSALVCIIISAAVFGLGHYVNGGLAHGVASLSTGLVFAGSYLLARPSGIFPAFVAAFTTHAAHNFMLLFVVASFVPQWA
ncbi:MAG: hypothetical protein CFE43_09495 [Burkholderiales bacterium PBB3]|nr:MAG: hypothetical protein CFE43_09495 [Burkholderiales bacterium PBB3]